VTAVAALRCAADGLRVTWDDGATSCYPWRWLRDHSHDEHTLHPLTLQRLIHSARLTDDPAVTALADEQAVRLTFGDGAAMLPLDFLRAYRRPATARAHDDIEPVLWHTAAELDGCRHRYEEVSTTDEGLGEFLLTVARHGFAICDGTPASTEATEALIRRIGYVRETVFGGFWSFTDDLSKADTAYTSLELLPHTDGTYSHDAPGLQMLHCLRFDGSGGSSTLVDGFAIAAHLRTHEPDTHRVLSTVDIPGHYLGDDAHLRSARPVLRHDRHGVLRQVSYNTADRAPFLLAADEMNVLYDALAAFDALTNDTTRQWQHVLRPGEALLFDNWRVLHGRHAYEGTREMCGAYLNREDFESRLRTLAVGIATDSP
jgi:trimethyllysine dioxygenase